MNTPQRESLDAALASLPLDIMPTRDLWPAIEQANRERSAPLRGPRRWPLALAASVALCLLVGALTRPLWHRMSGEILATRTAPVTAPVDAPIDAIQAIPASYELSADADYLATRAALERTFAERLALLAPKTRERVQLDLEVIRKANADIRDALRADPASPLLLQLLRSTWQQEFNLYTTVAHATDTLLTRRS